MNLNIAAALANKSIGVHEEVNSNTTATNTNDLLLDEKYKNYLNNLKKNYFENLSLSCPPSSAATGVASNKGIESRTINKKKLDDDDKNRKPISSRRKIVFTPSSSSTNSNLKV